MVVNMSRRSQFIAWVTAFGLFALGAAAAVALGRPTQIPADSGRQAVESRGRLRQLLTERYEVRKQIAEYVQQSFNIGRADFTQWSVAHIAMYEAKADLADDTAGRIRVYEELVEFLRDGERMAQRKAESGYASQLEASQAKAATIEAEIALEKLRMGQDRQASVAR